MIVKFCKDSEDCRDSNSRKKNKVERLETVQLKKDSTNSEYGSDSKGDKHS